MTAADKYYLKAKDYYPFDLEQAIEAIEYGLGCDDEHAGLLTLKGNIYFHYLKEFVSAAECFELALFYDPGFVDVYYAYIPFALAMKEYRKAAKLVAAARQVKGIEPGRILYLEGLLYEKQQNYPQAIRNLKLARQDCHSKECFTFYEEELDRVAAKNKIYNEQRQAINIIIK